MARPKVFQIEATVEGISPRKDGGMSIRFHTQEINDPRRKARLMEFFSAFGWLQFSDKEIHTVPSMPARKSDAGKSPSQRLRDTMFVDWKQNGHTATPFDTWYEQQMERHINYHKARLQ